MNYYELEDFLENYTQETVSNIFRYSASSKEIVLIEGRAYLLKNIYYTYKDGAYYLETYDKNKFEFLKDDKLPYFSNKEDLIQCIYDSSLELLDEISNIRVLLHNGLIEMIILDEELLLK